MMMQRGARWAFCIWAGLTSTALAADMHCFDEVAATRGYSLGTPANAAPTPDGKSVLYLRSGPRDTLQRLFEFDIASAKEHELVAPETLLGGGQERLSAEEKARRERARVSVSGFTAFSLSRDGSHVLLPLAGKLFVLTRSSGKVASLPGEGWIAPQWSPDGTKVAALRDDDLHVIDTAKGTDTQFTHGANDALQHGEAEFVAQEEMDRREGFWWSPDSRMIAFEEADLSPVETAYIGDPLAPQQKPVAFRYPRAGTANAIVRLGVVSVGNAATPWVPWDSPAGSVIGWISWDSKAYPYLARVEWMKGGPLALLVQNREQTDEKYLAADIKSGATHLLWAEHDSAWLDLPAPLPKEIPYWLSDGSGFLWMTERAGQTQLERHAANGKLLNAITPPYFRFEALLDVDESDGSVIVQGGTDRLSHQIYRAKLTGGAPEPLSTARGLHAGQFGEQHALFAHSYDLLDGSHGVDVLSRDGKKIADLPSVAEAPPSMPAPEYLTVGERGLDTLVLRPKSFDANKKYSVILSVYGGPASKTVWAAPRNYFANQCMADRGYIVVSSDNRGTPGRDRAWLRAVKGNAIDIPLQDQIDALQALAARVPQMDMSRAGVFGWSFGGYFSAMATIRRPDVFAAGIAGAPVTDWEDYDTYYTERYMGLPQANPDGYRKSNALTYASQLSRPLLVVHGITDDNVHFEHSMKLTLALLRAGKPYDLLLLPGTHMLVDDVLRARETEKQMDFFAAHLGEPR